MVVPLAHYAPRIGGCFVWVGIEVGTAVFGEPVITHIQTIIVDPEAMVYLPFVRR